MGRYAGSSGRLKININSPTLTSDELTFSGATAAASEITAWSVDDTMDGGAAKVLTFEAPANTQGVLHPELLRGGTGSWKASVEAVVESTSIANYVKGAAVVVDFMYKKSTAFGHSACGGIITSRKFKVAVNDKAATWSFEIEGDGVFPEAA